MFIGLFSPIQLEKYLQQSRSPRGPETDMEHDDKPIEMWMLGSPFFGTQLKL